MRTVIIKILFVCHGSREGSWNLSALVGQDGGRLRIVENDCFTTSEGMKKELVILTTFSMILYSVITFRGIAF